MLELKHINLATEEDRKSGPVRWVSPFKATTWKEIKMLADGNPTSLKDENTSLKDEVNRLHQELEQLKKHT